MFQLVVCFALCLLDDVSATGRPAPVVRHREEGRDRSFDDRHATANRPACLVTQGHIAIPPGLIGLAVIPLLAQLVHPLSPSRTCRTPHMLNYMGSHFQGWCSRGYNISGEGSPTRITYSSIIGALQHNRSTTAGLNHYLDNPIIQQGIITIVGPTWYVQ